MTGVVEQSRMLAEMHGFDFEERPFGDGFKATLNREGMTEIKFDSVARTFSFLQGYHRATVDLKEDANRPT